MHVADRRSYQFLFSPCLAAPPAAHRALHPLWPGRALPPSSRRPACRRHGQRAPFFISFAAPSLFNTGFDGAMPVADAVSLLSYPAPRRKKRGGGGQLFFSGVASQAAARALPRRAASAGSVASCSWRFFWRSEPPLSRPRTHRIREHKTSCVLLLRCTPRHSSALNRALARPSTTSSLGRAVGRDHPSPCGQTRPLAVTTAGEKTEKHALVARHRAFLLPARQRGCARGGGSSLRDALTKPRLWRESQRQGPRPVKARADTPNSCKMMCATFLTGGQRVRRSFHGSPGGWKSRRPPAGARAHTARARSLPAPRPTHATQHWVPSTHHARTPPIKRSPPTIRSRTARSTRCRALL